jgi:hypothetical protein
LRAAALRDALDAIRLVPDAERRAVVLAQLAALADDEASLEALPLAMLEIAREALESIVQTTPGEEQAHWLAALPPDLDAEVATHIQDLPDAWLRALAWAELAASRPSIGEAGGLAGAPTAALPAFIPGPEALLRAAMAYQEIQALPERLLVAPALFPLLPDEDRSGLLAELLLEATGALPAPQAPAASANGGDPTHPPAPGAVTVDALPAFSLLDGAIDFLPDDLLPHALALARAIAEPSRRLEMYARLAGRLPAAERLALADEGLAYLAALAAPAASTASAARPDEFGLAAGLSWLARIFPPERQGELIALAEGLSDGWARADALSALARAAGPHAERRSALLQAALSAARANTSLWKRARALTIVASRSQG